MAQPAHPTLGGLALNGLRVLDFGQYMAGPLAAMLLADHGADVIRVDPPGGPRWDTPANATWNRNKRSIVLDLKRPDDRAVALGLAARADVLIENFRPGVMERLGLGADALRARDPRLIHCSMPGFGAGDPRAADRAWEGVLGAATGAFRPKPAAGTGRPIYTVIPYASAYGAFLAAVSVAMAALARERTGQGQAIEIPLFDATFTAIGAFGLLVDGKAQPEPDTVWNRPLRCADGRWLMHVGNNKRSTAFLEAIGMARWRAAGLRPEEVGERFEAVTATRTAQEWEDFGSAMGTETVAVQTSAEWLRHPQARASGIVAAFDDPVLGRFLGPGVNVRLSATPGAVRTPRALPDADRASVLRELDGPPPPVPVAGGEALRAALQGVKVIDLCIILAGPTCGRTLAEFGADVIKIDSPRAGTVLRHNDINRAKRSLLLDLKTPEGMAIFWRLVEDADVVLQNFRDGVARQLGIDYESVRARRPAIIYGSMNTYGETGPYAGRPGHEQIGQAVSGMQERYGDSRPEMAPFPANDYGTGLMGCYGIALALLHRRRTGQGQLVSTALAYTATVLQSALLQDHEGKLWDEPRGQQALGRGPWYRMYAARDGWLFLAARESDVASCPELADLRGLRGTALEEALAQRMARRGVAEWEGLLRRHGIGAHRVVQELAALMTDPLVVRRGLSITRPHEGLGAVTTVAPGMRLSATPVTPGRPAPKPGSDARAILAQIGREGDLERLVRQGVIATDGVKAGC